MDPPKEEKTSEFERDREAWNLSPCCDDASGHSASVLRAALALLRCGFFDLREEVTQMLSDGLTSQTGREERPQ
jgi:hypothetical protein